MGSWLYFLLIENSKSNAVLGISCLLPEDDPQAIQVFPYKCNLDAFEQNQAILNLYQGKFPS
jgi:hypothetical protein